MAGYNLSLCRKQDCGVARNAGMRWKFLCFEKPTVFACVLNQRWTDKAEWSRKCNQIKEKEKPETLIKMYYKLITSPRLQDLFTEQIVEENLFKKIQNDNGSTFIIFFKEK